jgi:hypothetical protein
MTKGKTTPLLRNCPEGLCFYATNGEIYTNYADLHEGLKRMDAKTFRHHVKKANNDFQNWVQHVYSDHKLAKEFGLKPTRLGMAQNLAKRMKYLAQKHH